MAAESPPSTVAGSSIKVEVIVSTGKVKFMDLEASSCCWATGFKGSAVSSATVLSLGNSFFDINL
ncbi:hypothetical protein HN51_041336, partial [Arachis hypogaea]